MQEIEIHPHLFNPVYWHVVDIFKRPEIRHLYIYGGSSAAKTHSVAQALLIEGENLEFSSIVFRKEQASIKDTIFNDFIEIDREFQLDHEFQEFKIKLPSNIIRFRGVDKSSKVKGLKGYKKIFLDELDHFDYEDYKELKRRLRGEDLQQIIYTWNPVSKEHWVKKKILDAENWTEISKEIENCPSQYSCLSEKSKKWINDRGDSILIQTNHLDNYWVVGHPDERFGKEDKHVLTEFEIMAKLEPEDYKIYAWGEWGDPKVDSPYITQFEDEKHVSTKAVFNPNNQIIFSFDFNIDNCKVELSHVGENHIHFFDELTGHDLPELLVKIDGKYGKWLSNCIITGDRSGQNRTHMVSDNMNSYRLILNTLKLSSKQFKVVTNPPHKENRVTCNLILAYHPEVLINPICKDLIFDLKYVECDQDGKIIKADRTVANQKADALDCFRYTLNTFKRKFVKNYNK